MILIDISLKVVRRLQSIFAGEAGIVYAAIAFLVLYWIFTITNRKKVWNFLKRLTAVDIFLWIFVVISIFLVYRVSLRKTTPVFLVLTYQREFEREFPVPPEYWAVNKISARDVSYNSLGGKTAEVVEVAKSYWGANRENFSVLVKIEAISNSKTGEFILDGKPLLIGGKLSLTLGKTQFNGIITDLFTNEQDRFKGYRRARAVVKLKGRSYEPWQAEALRNFKVVNSKGKITAAVTDITVEPAEAEYVFTTNNGIPIRLRDPIKKDVTMTVELTDVLCAEQTCYVEETKPLKIGHDLWITSDKTVLPGANIMDFTIEYLD